MKKRITLITSILLIIALAVTFVGCNKDKTEETPTTTEKITTTEPTTFEAPEIKDEPTTEETTEETEASAPETTTKKSTYTGSTGSSGSSNSGSSGSSSRPASTTKANVANYDGGEVLDDGRVVVVTNPSGGGIYIDANAGKGNGSHSDDSVYATDPDVQDALEADKNPDAWGR